MVIFKVCEKAVEKANGKERKRGQDRVQDALLAPWEVAELGRGEDGESNYGEIGDQEDDDTGFLERFSGAEVG